MFISFSTSAFRVDRAFLAVHSPVATIDFFASNRLIFSSNVNSRFNGRLEWILRVSCKPFTPASRYEARQRFPQEWIRSKPVKSTSKPASSKMSRGSLPCSFCVIKWRLNSTVYVFAFSLTAITFKFRFSCSCSFFVSNLFV